MHSSDDVHTPLAGQTSSERRICVGIAVGDPHLEELLERIGVHVERLADRSDPAQDPFSCLILNGPVTDPNWDALIRSSVEDGSPEQTQIPGSGDRQRQSCRRVAILDLTGAHYPHRITKRTLRRGIARTDTLFGHLSDLPMAPLSVRVSASALHLHGAVHLEESTAYAWCGWPLTPERAATGLQRRVSWWQSADAAPLSYPMPQGETQGLDQGPVGASTFFANPCETVRGFSHAAARHVLLILLARLHHCIGLPLVHTWFYPGEADSVFLFRIDSDFGDRASVEDLQKHLRRWSVPSTWFLHTDAHTGWLDHFFRDPLIEPALHASRHRTFTDAASLRNDIQRALNALSDASELLSRDERGARETEKSIPTLDASQREIVGYAAPYGTYHPALRRVLGASTEAGRENTAVLRNDGSALRFAYSSEFSFSRDDLPIRQPGSTLPLQIPIHPICTGSLFRTKRSASQIREYFKARFKIQLHRKDPLIFYHHPLQGPHSLLEGLFEELERAGATVARLTFREWAEWWERRSREEFNAFSVPGSGNVRIVRVGSGGEESTRDTKAQESRDHDVRYCIWTGPTTIQIRAQGEHEFTDGASRAWVNPTLLEGVHEGYLLQKQSIAQHLYQIRSRVLDVLGRIDK